uniref:tRNA (uracil-O(2)-)-methyltransferase n=1 Tax=Talaromyces marneffei PM1 TaxID=1077442 RepID=A0A093V1Z9_TALMA
MAVRKRTPVASNEKPLRETLVPSVSILNRSYNDGCNDQETDRDVEPEGSAVTTATLPPTLSAEDDDGDFSKWMTSPDLIREKLPFTPDVMYNLNNFLLGSPNMNSPHLFRADIWYDSAGQLKTPREKERLVLGVESAGQSVDDDSGSYTEADAKKAPRISGFELKRTVIRELIPRRPQLDRALKQTCLYYEGVASTSSVQRALYLFMPDLKEPEDVPFYHPQIRGWGFLYDYEGGESSLSTQSEESKDLQHQGEMGSSGNGTLSLHILPFPATEDFDPFPVRLERILQNLLSTQIRLARNTRPTTTTTPPTTTDISTQSTSPNVTSATTGKKQEDDSYNPDKDNIIPRHMVQNTYTRLKTTYSQDLCKRWVENTEPSKHVFEDLAITAFLIELWRNMYGVIPRAEQTKQEDEEGGRDGSEFEGFVDIACGNGVLVYVLLMEGYKGWGFDARRRKTWSIFPEWVQENLEEAIYIPKPFAGEFASTGSSTTSDVNVGGMSVDQRIQSHNGIQYTTGNFPKKTFVISNHADELTVWTPLLAALACPEKPLPFLSIPCCSHALSGARYRYRPPKKEKSATNTTRENTEDTPNDNPQTGDLKALRAAKLAACTSQPDSDPNSAAVLNSMYGSLTAKTMSVAAEVGFDVEKTLLRIPSTRNMGVIGGRRNAILKRQGVTQKSTGAETIRRAINEVVERECAMDGGVNAAARIWVERAMGLQKPGKKS